MTIQAAIMADDDSSIAGTEFTTNSTAVSVASEPFDFNSPLYRPIPVPATVVPYSDDATKTTTETEPDEAEHYKIVEENRTSAQVHAACRLHEAVLVLTTALETLITRCSGLSVPEAAAACRIYNANNGYTSLMSENRESPDRRSAAEKEAEKGHQRAMMLVNMRHALLVLTEGAATTVRMAMETRNLAVSQGLLLPLSVLGDEMSEMNQINETKNTNATFSAFLQRGPKDLTNNQDLLRLCRSITENRYPLECIMELAWNNIYTFFGIMSAVGDEGPRSSGLPYELREAANCSRSATNAITTAVNNKKNSKENEDAAREAINHMVTRLITLAVKDTASHAEGLAKTAMKIIQWQRPFRGVVSQLTLWATGRTRGRRPQDDDDEMLWQALAACEQAVAASEAAIRPFISKARLA